MISATKEAREFNKTQISNLTELGLLSAHLVASFILTYDGASGRLSSRVAVVVSKRECLGVGYCYPRRQLLIQRKCLII